jgi:hypothetical protein
MPSPLPTPAPARRGAATIAMPISAAPLFRPDFERSLEDMRARGAVNTLLPFIYTHEAHRAGLPESRTFRGGNYAIPHLEYYRDLPFSYADMRAPEFGGRDAFALALPAARKLGMKVFAWLIEDNHCPAIRSWEPLYEVDVHGRRTTGHPCGPCKRNPLYRAFLLDLAEDYLRSYGIDGLMWGAERQSGFLNTLGMGKPGQATCFCPYCLRAAKEAGIDAVRAGLGFAELEWYRRQQRSGYRARDGDFVEFWRILRRYPELVAWENLWVRGRNELQAELYRRVKSVNPAAVIGWHVWQDVTFSPFQRAEVDYAELGGHADFVRPALYNHCAGARMRTFAQSALAGAFGDLPAPETLELLYRLLGDEEAPYDRVAAAGFSADYVRRETRRAVEDLTGSPAEVWPGIDIDVPAPPAAGRCTPEGIREAVQAAVRGGAEGLILSRNYTEMAPAHLSAAGEAIREIGLA